MKVTKGATYVHPSAVEYLEKKHQVIYKKGIAMMSVVYGDVEYFDLIKIAHGRPVISFLRYPFFDELGHPALYRSMLFNVETKTFRTTRFKKNRPILHRKELFVRPGYKFYQAFKSLTDDEVAAGLLKNPPGRVNEWNRLLKRAGFFIEGHKLRKAK